MGGLIKNYVSTKTGATSDKGVVSDTLCYNGSLFLDDNGDKYFYRKRVRLKEVIAGRPEGYSLGIEDEILKDLQKRSVSYILIETQYKKYKISLSKFLNNCFHYGFGNVVSCCIMDNFYIEDLTVKKEVSFKEAEKKEQNKKAEKEKVKYGDQGSLFIYLLLILKPVAVNAINSFI